MWLSQLESLCLQGTSCKSRNSFQSPRKCCQGTAGRCLSRCARKTAFQSPVDTGRKGCTRSDQSLRCKCQQDTLARLCRWGSSSLSSILSNLASRTRNNSQVCRRHREETSRSSRRRTRPHSCCLWERSPCQSKACTPAQKSRSSWPGTRTSSLTSRCLQGTPRRRLRSTARYPGRCSPLRSLSLGLIPGRLDMTNSCPQTHLSRARRCCLGTAGTCLPGRESSSA